MSLRSKTSSAFLNVIRVDDLRKKSEQLSRKFNLQLYLKRGSGTGVFLLIL